jgi:hypothetical protein
MSGEGEGLEVSPQNTEHDTPQILDPGMTATQSV